MSEDPDNLFTDDEEKDLLEEEESAAAAEAARIGGRTGMERLGMDEAKRSVAEAGGGQSEGFEEAEELLKENAGHGDPGGDPLSDAPEPEAEEDPGVYGEADTVESTEIEDDEGD
jgi:hypothetical protein